MLPVTMTADPDVTPDLARTMTVLHAELDTLR
jgi:hypothetical protein